MPLKAKHGARDVTSISINIVYNYTNFLKDFYKLILLQGYGAGSDSVIFST